MKNTLIAYSSLMNEEINQFWIEENGPTNCYLRCVLQFSN